MLNKVLVYSQPPSHKPQNTPLSSEFGTRKAFKARFWPWLSGESLICVYIYIYMYAHIYIYSYLSTYIYIDR